MLYNIMLEVAKGDYITILFALILFDYHRLSKGLEMESNR